MRAIEVADGRVVLPGLQRSAEVQVEQGLGTDMVSNMGYFSVLVMARARDHVGKVPLVDLDIYVVCRAKGRNLHVVTIGATFCHSAQVVLECVVYVGLGGSSSDGGERADILPLGVPPGATARLSVYELLVVVGMLSHVGNDLFTDDVVFFLVAVQLITKSVEKTISWLD